jgi:hypothetical protein
MTVQLLHSDFPIYEGKFDFIFYQCTVSPWQHFHGHYPTVGTNLISFLISQPRLRRISYVTLCSNVNQDSISKLVSKCTCTLYTVQYWDPFKNSHTVLYTCRVPYFETFFVYHHCMCHFSLFQQSMLKGKSYLWLRCIDGVQVHTLLIKSIFGTNDKFYKIRWFVRLRNNELFYITYTSVI